MTELTETKHHGTRLWWSDEPGPFSAALVFGVGTIDEPVHLSGITHLLEHLVFRRLGPAFALADGVTGPESVQFSSSGDRDSVTSFLHAVADVVRTVPFTDEDLRRELRAMRAETPSTVVWERGLSAMRYGATGAGAASSGTPALPAVTLEEVREWARHWFVAANAVVVLTGPPPADLEVRLPEGQVVVHDEPRPLTTEPTLVLTRKSGVALSLILPWSCASLVLNAFAHDLMVALRHEVPLIYSVALDGARVGATDYVVDAILDPLDEDVPATLRALVAAVRRIEQDGLSEQACALSRSDRERDRPAYDPGVDAPLARWGGPQGMAGGPRGRGLPATVSRDLQRDDVPGAA